MKSREYTTLMQLNNFTEQLADTAQRMEGVFLINSPEILDDVAIAMYKTLDSIISLHHALRARLSDIRNHVKT